MENKSKLSTLIRRLKPLGIEMEMFGNYPWIYLDKVNGIRVTEKFMAEHGFTIAFSPLKNGDDITLSDNKEVFKVIRKYIKKSETGTYEHLQNRRRGRSKH